jgi:hypothetical protein
MIGAISQDDYWEMRSGARKESKMENVDTQIPSDYLVPDYTGPMVDTEGRGAVVNRERVNGRLATVYREKLIRIVGCGFNNSNGEKGSERQDILKSLAAGDVVSLVREPLNEYDPNALAVQFGDGPERRIGYVPKAIAGGIAADIDGGWTPYGLVESIQASGRSGELYANIHIFQWEEGPALD